MFYNIAIQQVTFPMTTLLSDEARLECGKAIKSYARLEFTSHCPSPNISVDAFMHA